MESNRDKVKIPLWAKFLYTGTIVTIISLITKKYKTSIGSIMYSFPYTFLLTITILVTSGFTWREFKKFSFYSMIGLSSKIIFSFFFYGIYKKTGLYKGLVISFIPWVLTALLIYYKPYENIVNKYIIE